ncbi:MAG: replication initiator protein [Microvirus sp.]|nr:MAG: replication initiator protein [Microvirus sp.]
MVGGSKSVPCFNPLTAYRLDDGSVSLVERGAVHSSLQLPCGKCVGCRLERSRQWAIRIMHESSYHDKSSFITLTYDDDHVPPDYSLRYRDFQLFCRYLRRDGFKFRYFVCGEYGDNFKRPHFHACIFGLDFSEDGLEPVGKSPAGSVIFSSKMLSRYWTKGFASVGELSFQSAAYVARYVIKKQSGSEAASHYRAIDAETGETFEREPEFVHMSLKPGIGAGWFKKFNSDVFPHDHVVHDGRPTKPPRYYDVLLKRINPDLYATIKEDRVFDAVAKMADNTPARLAVKEHVALARLSFKKRSLK